MTILFGTLIQAFVNFGIVVEQAKFGDARAQAQVPIAAIHFRRVAVNNACYLVYLSEPYCKLIRDIISELFLRPWDICLLFHLHERVGIYQRNRCKATSGALLSRRFTPRY